MNLLSNIHHHHEHQQTIMRFSEKHFRF